MKEIMRVGDMVRVRLPPPELRSDSRKIPWNAVAQVVLPSFRIVEPTCRKWGNRKLRPGVYPGNIDWDPALISYREKVFVVAMKYLHPVNRDRNQRCGIDVSREMAFPLETLPCVGDTVIWGMWDCELIGINYNLAIAEYFSAEKEDQEEDQERTAFCMRCSNRNPCQDAKLADISILERGNVWKYWWGEGKGMHFHNTLEEAAFFESVGACDFLTFAMSEGSARNDLSMTTFTMEKIANGHADAISSSGEIFTFDGHVRVIRFHDRERGERIREVTLKLLRAKVSSLIL